MQFCGSLMDKAFQEDPHSLRIFSPDGLVSNKLNAVFDHTGRNFQWDEFSNAQGGRVIEILSEHCCQGFMQGYTLTGCVALFPSYESFLGIIHTMVVQYAKFGKMAQEVSWRRPLGWMNYLETSTWTQQEYNGFSHRIHPSSAQSSTPNPPAPASTSHPTQTASSRPQRTVCAPKTTST